MLTTENKPFTVLVVDDEHAYRQLARDALSGYEKWIASTAQEGLDIFHEHQPDICFLDLCLNGESGLEMLLEIREEVPEAFVSILTTSRQSEDVALARRCAANAYITKPFSRRQLRDCCDAGLRHRHWLESMNALEHSAFRQRMREDAEAMYDVLHKPTPERQAALSRLMARWPVLLVGAEEAQHWAKTLCEAGCVVHHCSTAQEAMAELAKSNYRLLVTEDTLPDSDASELLYRMRINHVLIPAMVVVDADWKRPLTKWRKVGARRVMSGPLSARKLRATVEREMLRSLPEMDDIVLHL